ncbi:hypothetical protein FB45DRAFT_753559 [Roridomyces roridus]|uniref:BTB domain-containing protein n=1 Tax=Roridomyces roridus TaxID=1738132 RepID=A0AAD7FJ57_9AGAR|nr:hypothetical protein FB45DRAFT_753559 [Roridomyces roridus]
MTTPSDPIPFKPSQPFCDPAHGDIILRATDDAIFHVHRVVLSIASPILKDTLSIPQPTASAHAPEISMPHSGPVLDRECFFYPGAQPIVESLTQLREILEILVDRCDVQSVVNHGQVYLRAYITEEPLRVYAIAVRHGWDDLAREAAKECLKLPLRSSALEPPVEFCYVSGLAYPRLVQYHYRCGQAGQQGCRVPDPRPLVRSSHEFGGSGKVPKKCPSCRGQGWLDEYRERMGEKIQVTPVRSIQDPVLEIQVMEKAGDCSTCRGWAEELFKNGWNAIDAAISKACLVVAFVLAVTDGTLQVKLNLDF